MTLAGCIRRHESAHESRQTAVTPLGTAISAGTRFVTAVAALDEVLACLLADLKAIEPVTV